MLLFSNSFWLDGIVSNLCINFCDSTFVHIVLHSIDLFHKDRGMNRSKIFQHALSKLMLACYHCLCQAVVLHNPYRLCLDGLKIGDKEAEVIGELLKECKNLSSLS